MCKIPSMSTGFCVFTGIPGCVKVNRVIHIPVESGRILCVFQDSVDISKESIVDKFLIDKLRYLS